MSGGDDTAGRLQRLESRVDAVESRLRDDGLQWREQLATVRRDMAVVAEGFRLSEDVLERVQDTQAAVVEGQANIRSDVGNVRILFAEHMAEEARDRQRLLIGTITAAVSGLGTLGALLWAVVELLGK